MNRILYFAPGKQVLGLEEMWRLEPVLQGCAVTSRLCVGPGGENGVIFAVGDEAPGYRKEGQVWEEGQDSQDGIWMGYEPGARPGPGDLAREDGISGHPVTLRDGQAWELPVLRVAATGTILGSRRIAKRGPGGEWLGKLPAELEDLARWVEEAFGSLRAVVEGQVELRYEYDLAAAGLALNYRVGAGEISLLELLDPKCAAEAVLAMLDWPTFVALADEKKKGSGVGDG